jgi:hypothetical protein
LVAGDHNRTVLKPAGHHHDGMTEEGSESQPAQERSDEQDRLAW